MINGTLKATIKLRHYLSVSAISPVSETRGCFSFKKDDNQKEINMLNASTVIQGIDLMIKILK